MNNKVLILNGSLSEIPVIKTAKEMGYYVITSGNAPDLIGHAYADEYIPADYSNCERILEIVKENNISRIISCANDFGAITAAYVAEKMGWPGHDTYENTVLLHQKDRFKQFFYENGIRSPHSIPFTDEDEALEYAKTAEYPIIAKAVDLTGGKGIHKAENYAEAETAIAEAFSRSRIKHIVIEPYIVGMQESIDTFVVNKKVVAFVTNNAYSPINPYLIQTEVLPSDNQELLKDELCGIIEFICEKLDLVDGVFTLQYIVKDGKPYVIELMRRLLGNQFLTVATKVSGFPWHEALVRAELGLDCSLLKADIPEAKNVGHHGIMARRNGKIKRVTIDPEIEEHIFQRIDILQPGEMLNDYMNERVAYIYYAYDNRKEIIDVATHLNERIKIEFEE